MTPRPLFAVAVAALVLLAGVGPVGGDATGGDAAADLSAAPVADATPGETIQRDGDAGLQYKVSLDNVTIRTWLLRNSTVVNATVGEVVIRNATTTNGNRTNVTLSNVTVGQFGLERARLTNVTANTLVVRNKSVLSVPGGELIDPNVENRTIDRHWTRNQTVSGVVIDRIAVDAAILCENATLGQEASNPATFDPTTDEDDPDITVQNGTVGEALIMQGAASNWSVGSVQQPSPSNASLPQGCNRG